MQALKPLIIALSSRGDVTTDYVVRAVDEAGGRIARVNTDDFLSTWRMQWQLGCKSLESDARRIKIDDVTGVYYRRAFPPEPTSETADAAWAFVQREGRAAIRGLYSSLRCPWISDHAAIASAENKPRQLELAMTLGFRVPDTVITNSPHAAKAFLKSNKRVVLKAISYGNLGAGKVLHTTILPAWREEFGREIELCPILLQCYIQKRCDWRVTVVDDRVFACRIQSQANPQYAVDMRKGLADPAMAHELAKLPERVEEQCVAMVRLLGLRFGAIDLVEDEDGTLWFLEINPNGQWAWIEDRTGARIARTIAEALLE